MIEFCIDIGVVLIPVFAHRPLPPAVSRDIIKPDIPRE